MLYDINTEPISERVRRKANELAHPIRKVITVRQLLNYFLFTLGLRVFLHVEDRPDKANDIWSISLQRIDPAQSHDVHLLSSKPIGREGTFEREKELWDTGLRDVFSWASHSCPSSYRATVNGFNPGIHTYFFEFFDLPRLESFKKALSSYSPSSKGFKFYGINNVNPELAKHVIDYVEFMLSDVQAVTPTIIEEPIVEVITTAEAIRRYGYTASAPPNVVIHDDHLATQIANLNHPNASFVYTDTDNIPDPIVPIVPIPDYIAQGGPRAVAEWNSVIEADVRNWVRENEHLAQDVAQEITTNIYGQPTTNPHQE